MVAESSANKGNPLPLNLVGDITTIPETSPSNSTHSDVSDSNEIGQDDDPIEQMIGHLKSRLSQVKNKRDCTWSAYDYMRHLSILRYFEWTLLDMKPEQDVARQLAELLWIHNSGNSINHKA